MEIRYSISRLVLLAIIFQFSCSSHDSSSKLCSSTYKKCLIDYLISEDQLNDPNDHSALFIVNLDRTRGLGVFDESRLPEGNGVYSFGILGSHLDQFIFFKTDNGIQILTDYSLSSTLDALSKFYRASKLEIDRHGKLEILKGVIDVIEMNIQNELVNDVPEMDLESN